MYSSPGCGSSPLPTRMPNRSSRNFGHFLAILGRAVDEQRIQALELFVKKVIFDLAAGRDDVIIEANV